MAYSTPATRAAGYIILATNWNELVNNFIAMAPDAFTANGDIYVASAANVGVKLAAFTSSTGVLKRASGGLEVALSDPGADRILFWDNDADDYAYLAVDSTLTISGTTLSMTTAARTEASQGDMQDKGTSNANRYVSPEVAKFSPSGAKVWISWEQTGLHEERVSEGISTTVDGSAAGDTDHEWTVDFSSADYVPVAAGGSGAIMCSPKGNSQVAGGITTITADHAGNDIDNDENFMVVFGTLATV